MVGSHSSGIATILYEFDGENEPDDGALELRTEGFIVLLEGSSANFDKQIADLLGG